MNFSAFFIRRPVGTMLLTLGIALAGIVSYVQLPVAPLPQIDFPTINVLAQLPGASPETMGSSVAEPLEKRLRSIAGLNEITSRSNTGLSQITMQFDLDRSADKAAREVQAAINAARGDLPATLKSNPTYRKLNPASAPILILSLTSDTRSPAQVYDAVATQVQQRLLRVPGVGDVQLAGASLPAVRIDIDLEALNQRSLSLEDLRSAIQSSKAERPKGVIETSDTAWTIETPGAKLDAQDYADVIVAYRNGAPVRLSDVAYVHQGAEDNQTAGYFNGARALDVIISREPGANIIATIDGVKAQLPELRKAIPADIRLDVASDLSSTIRASLHEVEVTLIIAILLVIGVVGAFLRSWRATVVPAVATIVSLLGTLALMYGLGFSLNNLSLMALTIATGFVVDDAIVVIENIQRHIEEGAGVLEASLKGAQEVGFTVLSISLSLVAVFIPILFMGGLPGRLFNEFAVTMTIAVLISLVLSLTTTPMLASLILSRAGANPHAGPDTGADAKGLLERGFDRLNQGYASVLDWSLSHRRWVLGGFVGAFLLQVGLFAAVPKGLFPEQDTGTILGAVRSDEAMSFASLNDKLQRIAAIVKAEPGVENVVAFTGGRLIGGGFLFITLKPIDERAPVKTIVQRLREPLAQVSGTKTFLNPVQDLRTGGRQSNATYQYTLTSHDEEALKRAASALMEELRKDSVNHGKLVDLDNDMSANAVSAHVEIDRARAAQLGITPATIDQTLYDAFGQRLVSIIYEGINQYHAVMGVAPGDAPSPQSLARIYVPTGSLQAASRQTAGSRDASTGSALSTQASPLVPLSAFAHWNSTAAASQVNHDGGESAATISFNLTEGATLGEAARIIDTTGARLGLAPLVKGAFAGTAAMFQSSMSSLPLLVLLAIAVIYIVLGILYESWIHPLTVLSTLPPAGLGAVAGLGLLGMQFDLIGAIGLLLLIGIVKKNAILIIDFALEAERKHGRSPLEAIREASLLRFRPIMMTTLAAALGALPLAIGFGTGSELRQPLGVTIFGGLLVSQLLTLFTTPVIYLMLDRFRKRDVEETVSPPQGLPRPI